MDVGLTTLLRKKSFVTKTQTREVNTIEVLGEEGVPEKDPMMPSGQSRKDTAEQKPPSSSKDLRIGSWNVRTLYEAGKTAQVIQEMQKYRLDLLGISETHWSQAGEKRTRTGEFIVYSGHEEEGQHKDGVAIILNKRAQKTLRGWEAHGPRILMASFTTKKKRINMNIIQAYAPTNEATDEDKDNFYHRLQDVMDQLPNKDVNILMGDMNAKVGGNNISYEQGMGRHGLGEINDNGERFVNHCSINNLVIGGTIFPHKRIHKATWISPDGRTENQIDHFCISCKFRRSLRDVRVMRGADVASDHHLLLAKVKLKLRKFESREGSRRLKFQVNLLQDTHRKQEFELALKNRFQLLQDLEETDIEEHWTKIREIFESTCKEELGPKTYKNKDWMTQESLDKVEERKRLKTKINNSRTRAEKLLAQQEYGEKNREVRKAIQKDKNIYLEELAERAEKAAANGHMRIVHQITKTLSGKRSKPVMPVKDLDGKSIFDREGQLNRWRTHFCQLLNRPPPDEPPDILPARTDLPIETGPPSKEEIAKSISQLRSWKAAGPDNIPPEALKADIPVSVEILHGLFDKIWKEEKIPNEWKEGHIIKLPKKGDLSNCNSYRGISLLSIPGKVFNRVILNRIKDITDEKLRDQQAGFRKNRSCADQIATLRIIVEQSEEWNSPAVINFVDFEKAFDSVDRNILWKLMRHYGIPEKIVSLVKFSYDGTNCQVFHDGQLSDPFDINTGVRQGCLLSPFLFILIIDWIMKETTKGRRNGLQWTLWQQLDDLDFADDIALISHSQEQMQAKTDHLHKISERVGLKIHPGKSKVLKIGNVSANEVTLGTTPLEEVEEFTYLGSIIDKKGGTEADIKARIGKARTAFTQLQKVWKASKVSVKLKIRLFNSNVKSVLMYGCETWKATNSMVKRIQTFVNRCLRKILKIRWEDRIRNEVIWERAEQAPMEEQLGKRRWRWIGHTLRKPPSSTTRHALQWNPQGTRSRGRPRETWRRCVERDRERTGRTWSQLTKMSQDRKEWKALVCGLYPDRGDGR